MRGVDEVGVFVVGVFGGAGGGGGGGAREGVGTLDGMRGAEAGGVGGAGGRDGAADTGGGGAAVDGFLDVIGGGGGFAPVGSGGAPRGGKKEASELGRGAGFDGGLRRFATSGLAAEDGRGGDDSVVCGTGLNAFIRDANGGFGAKEVGGLGADWCDVSGSEIYEDSLSAPVSTPPPVFRSLGIPTPANIPPSWGAVAVPPLSPPTPLP